MREPVPVVPADPLGPLLSPLLDEGPEAQRPEAYINLRVQVQGTPTTFLYLCPQARVPLGFHTGPRAIGVSQLSLLRFPLPMHREAMSLRSHSLLLG